MPLEVLHTYYSGFLFASAIYLFSELCTQMQGHNAQLTRIISPRGGVAGCDCDTIAHVILLASASGTRHGGRVRGWVGGSVPVPL